MKDDPKLTFEELRALKEADVRRETEFKFRRDYPEWTEQEFKERTEQVLETFKLLQSSPAAREEFWKEAQRRLGLEGKNKEFGDLLCKVYVENDGRGGRELWEKAEKPN
jgi:hypothetical protein